MKAKSKRSRFKSAGGQIVLEYVLLIIIGLTLALVINRSMIADAENLEDMGFVRLKWIEILQKIGEDIPDPKNE